MTINGISRGQRPGELTINTSERFAQSAKIIRDVATFLAADKKNKIIVIGYGVSHAIYKSYGDKARESFNAHPN